MTSHSEDVLFALLSDTEGLEELCKDGMDLECVPTEDARPIVQWCIDYFFQSNMTRAPTIEMITEMWGQQLEDLEINLGDGTETDTMESVIGVLKKNYVEWKTQQFVKQLGTDMAKAGPTEKIKVLNEGVETLAGLSMTFERRDALGISSEAATAAMARYEQRVALGRPIQGMTLGMDVIDDHYLGIHDGELAVLAAGPKMGKSFFGGCVAITNWLNDQNVYLATLENSVEMTWDRLCCLRAAIDYRKFQRGECDFAELARLEQARDQFSTRSNQIFVEQPSEGKRTARAIVDAAYMRNCDGLIIDQLTFLETPRGRLQRDEVIKVIMHGLKNAINRRRPIPCLLNHQINREGVKAAQKVNHLEMYHMAEGAEVERTADVVFGLFQNQMERQMGQAKFQGLACRREEDRSWMIQWTPAHGDMPRAHNEWVPYAEDMENAN